MEAGKPVQNITLKYPNGRQVKGTLRVMAKDRSFIVMAEGEKFSHTIRYSASLGAWTSAGSSVRVFVDGEEIHR